MRISNYVCGPLGVNTYIVQDEGTGKAVIIDAAEFFCELKEHIDRIGKENIAAILLTHCHFDHTMGAAELRDYTGAPVMIHNLEQNWVDDPEYNGVKYFMMASGTRFPKPDKVMHNGDVIEFGDSSLTVMHTPGHSPGSCCFVSGDVIFSGDTLFQVSVGRTDLPGGNSRHLRESLSRLTAMDDDCKVYPGHGSPTTIGYERQNNPFME